MKDICVITDSHSGIGAEEAEKLGVWVLPMPFYINDECYYENVNLTRDKFFEYLKGGAKVSTSQPSPISVMECWDKALLEYKNIIYMPLSSGLSGSCMSAMAMAEDEPYKGRVFVVDNGRASTLLHRAVLDALELIDEGYSAPEIKKILEAAKDKMVIYVGVQTLEFLKKGGRITPATALLGSVLNIKPVLKFDIGTLDTFQKCRGFAKARKTMIDAVRHNMETDFKEWYDRNEIYLVAASSGSAELTEDWVNQIKEEFPGMDVMCDDLTMGLSCHIGYDGLGIGCSCRPKRI